MSIAYEEHCKKYDNYMPMFPIGKDNRYKGWYYQADYDHEIDGDCTKIYHYARGWPVDYVTIDWTPYVEMTDVDFKLWIDLGMPGRNPLNNPISGGPLRQGDLETLRDWRNTQTQEQGCLI